MMTSQIFNLVDSPKAQKSKSLDNETLFLLQITKFIHHIKGYMLKNSFLEEKNFKNDVQVLNRHTPLYTIAKGANFQ